MNKWRNQITSNVVTEIKKRKLEQRQRNGAEIAIQGGFNFEN